MDEKKRAEFARMFEDEITSPEFLHGKEVGKSLGRYESTEEALRFHAEGRIEEWIEAIRPKSAEEWAAWRAKNGPIAEFFGWKLDE